MLVKIFYSFRAPTFSEAGVQTHVIAEPVSKAIFHSVMLNTGIIVMTAGKVGHQANRVVD